MKPERTLDQLVKFRLTILTTWAAGGEEGGGEDLGGEEIDFEAGEEG